MEDIKNIKIYIQNNYPNISIIGNEDYFFITNKSINSKIYKKLEDEFNAEEVNNYLTEFKLKSRKIFTDMSKFDKFDNYKNLWEQFLKHDPSHENCSGITAIEWLWEHDDKTEILIDIESCDDNGLYGAIFKDQQIIYINNRINLIVQNNIDENLIKRTKTFQHIKFFECDEDHENNYYSEEGHSHQHCIGIIDYSDSNTEYYDKEKVPKSSKGCIRKKEEEIELLEVVPYDLVNKIYQDVNHGFLVKEIDEDICCYKKIINGQEIELAENDKIICCSLGIVYRKF
jgi:hypothetical protein